MPLAEIAAAITGTKASIDLAKAMIDLRDSSAFMTKSIELQTALLETLGQSIAARETQSLQLDQIRALETEVAKLKGWEAEKQTYELVTLTRGSLAFMLKPSARGSSPPHWLCPNCFANGKKSFFLPSVNKSGFSEMFQCAPCGSQIYVKAREHPAWQDQPA